MSENMNPEKEQPQDSIQDALRRPTDPDEDAILNNDQKEIERLAGKKPIQVENAASELGGTETNTPPAPTGPIPPSPFAMMQTMQNRMGDEYTEDPKATPPKMSPTSEPQSGGEMIVKDSPTVQHPPKETETGILPLQRSPEEKETQAPNAIPEFETSTNNTATFPSVLNTRNQLAPTTSTPESAEGERHLTALIEFVNGTTFSADWVRQHLNEMERGSSLLPLSTQWKIPFKADISKAVYDTIRANGYVERRFSSLEIVMTTSIDNPEWCASVLCLFAMIDVLEMLGPVHEQLRSLSRGLAG